MQTPYDLTFPTISPSAYSPLSPALQMPVASTSAASMDSVPSFKATTGKRRRASAAIVSAEVDEGAASSGDEESKARKKRSALSCVACRTRKIKCDRALPCSACVRRRVAHNCTFDDDTEAQNDFALSTDVKALTRRLALLESLFEQTHPGLLPQWPARSTVPGITSSAFGSPRSPGPRAHSPRPHVPANKGEPPRAGRSAHRSRSASDAEDAAEKLEDVAFQARVPVLRALNATQSSAPREAGQNPAQSRGGGDMTDVGTSIIAEPLSYDQDGRPRSAVRLGLDLAIPSCDLPNARSASMSQIFAVLPGRDIACFLIDKYFNEMEWDYRILDPVAFPQEHERYLQMLSDGRQDEIDPLFVAVLCMVLALSLEGFWSRPGGVRGDALFRGLTEREMQDLPSVWHDAALRALQLGEHGGTPRIRTIQCVVLFVQYIQLSSPSGQQGRILGWVASGIRVAQRLGLHRLGHNPQTMPPDDPALPPGKNAMKRDMAVRLWNQLVVIDSFLSDSPLFRCYLLHPSQYNTQRPANLNFSDFSRTDWRTPDPRPLSEYTDASFEIAQVAGAAQIRRALDSLVLSTDDFTYAAVMDQDREYRTVLRDLPAVLRDAPTSSVRIRYQRALLHEDIYARLVRLHRPFLARGYSDRRYSYSRAQCVDAARSILVSNEELLSITSSHWWLFISSMRSAIVLFMDLFHVIDEADSSSDQEIREKRAVLMKAAVIFGGQVAIPALQAVIEQGRRILAGLFAAEEARRTVHAAHTLATHNGSSPALESFSQVLKRVSREVSLEEARAAAATLSGHHGPMQTYPHPTTDSEDYSRQAQAAGLPVLPSLGTTTYTPAGYWPPGTTVAAGLGYGGAAEHPGGPLEAGPPGAGIGASISGEFSTFFETLASEDWGVYSGSEGGGSNAETPSGLLGQMAHTWGIPQA